MANGTPKNVGLGKFWQDLEISEAFLTSLEISFLHGLFLLFLSLETFYQRVSGSDNYDLGVSANLGFYHSLPLKVSSDGPETVERCIFSWFTWNIFYNFYIATTLTTTTILLNLVQSKGRAFTGKMK